ncbi:MAG: hypothetical protein NZ519_04395 [Bacteroidia bacterium]|nr:hypothetical protein [Bacteroidia bacterium]MDW8347681.1 hypothetical protein [Bacteroidia bacterium]
MEILKKIKNIVSDTCVTIILNTHRTYPENKQDPIALKNLIKEAEQRLIADEGKRNAQTIIEKLHKIENEIDHNYNLESLVIFVNEEIAEFVRLPISVDNRVIIDKTFATRDLVRALKSQANYYVLVLSQQKARLIEAFNDKVVQEIGKPFPYENTQFYSTSGDKRSEGTLQTNLMAEFFNRIDKAVNEARKNNPKPVMICSEEVNYHKYLEVCDQKHSILPVFLNKNRLEEKAEAIVAEAWKILKEYQAEKNKERKAELLKAVSQNKFMTDINDIWQAIRQGKVQTLFLQQNQYQPAIIKNDGLIELVPEERKNEKGVIDDIYDELTEECLKFGGDVVFLPEGDLSEFNGLGAVLRYN